MITITNGDEWESCTFKIRLETGILFQSPRDKSEIKNYRITF